MEKIPILVVVGPTAGGKSAYAIKKAIELGGEIISGDSMQIYREMNIGTAKPTKEEMEGMKYLFFDIDGTLKAGGYDNEYIPTSTKRAIELLRAEGHFLAIATGRSEAMARKFLKELEFENMVSDGGYGITIAGLGLRNALFHNPN